MQKQIRLSQIPIIQNPLIESLSPKRCILMNCLVKFSIEGIIVKDTKELSRLLSPLFDFEFRSEWLRIWFEEKRFWIEKNMLHSKFFDSLDIDKYESFVRAYKKSCYSLFSKKDFDKEEIQQFKSLLKGNEFYYYIFALLNKTKYNIPFYWTNNGLNPSDYLIFYFLKKDSYKTSEGVILVEVDVKKLKSIFGFFIPRDALLKFKRIGLLKKMGCHNRHKIYEINTSILSRKRSEKEKLSIIYNI